MGSTRDQQLLRALEDLTAAEFKKFKFLLNEVAEECALGGVPRGPLEKADPTDLAVLITTHYSADWLRVTLAVLRRLPNLPVAEQLERAAADGACGSSVPSATNSQGKAEQHFVDRHREAIVARNCLVVPILDRLLGKQLTPEQYDVILSKDTEQNKMRQLYRFVNGWGRADKDRLYEVLEAQNGPLIRDLQDQEKVKN